MQKEPNTLDDVKDHHHHHHTHSQDHLNESPVANRHRDDRDECTPLNTSKIPPGAVALPGPQSHQLISQQQQQQQQLHLHQQLQQQQQQQQSQQQLLSHHYHSNNPQGQRSLLTATSLNHHQQQINLTSNSSTIV